MQAIALICGWFEDLNFKEQSISIKIRSIFSLRAKKKKHIHLIFMFLFVSPSGKKLFTSIIRTKTIRCISLYSTLIVR